jgi:50S ribosomal subunit-associated GTPase HflX
VLADRSVVEEMSPDELRVELAKLEAAEARLSAERDRLHNQIDFGFQTTGTREREREVSGERRRLHDRIDELKKQLGTQQTA